MSQQFTAKQRGVLRGLFIPQENTSDFASSSQGAKADSAVQPNRSVNVGTGLTGGGDLSSNRTISLNAATIASLNLANTAVQPSRTITAGTGLTGGGDLSSNITISLSAASIASLALADTALQTAPVLKLSTQTGIAISTITIPATPYTNSNIILFKNKLMLREGISYDFTVSGATITLAVAAIAGDVFDIYYMAT